MMGDTLRRRLIVSHILPLLIVIPVMGVALTYVLETRVLLVNLGKQLTAQAVLLAELARERPEIWSDQAQAKAFVDRINPLFPADVTLIRPDGTILASTDGGYAGRVGTRATFQSIPAALRGEQPSIVYYNRDSRADAVSAMVAVGAPGEPPAGLVRLSETFGNVFDRFQTLRYLIIEVLAGSLLLATVLGWLLATRLARPLGQVTEAAQALATGSRLGGLAEEGPAEIRRLVRAFNTLSERLRNLEAARRQLLDNLVHELGRPLGAMAAATHALRAGAQDDPELRRELIAGVDGEIGRLERLLDDLGEMDEQLLGPVQLKRQPLHVDGWLADMLSPWREAAVQKGLAWQTEIAGDLPAVDADPGRLAQALGNLLSNAIKYTPAGGRVAVEACREGQVLVLAVEDSGPGIAAEEQANIFKPFYRSPTGRRYPQGMGIGLSIAADLVAAHGGTIALQSAPGRGSCFAIRLPLPPS